MNIGYCLKSDTSVLPCRPLRQSNKFILNRIEKDRLEGRAIILSVVNHFVIWLKGIFDMLIRIKTHDNWGVYRMCCSKLNVEFLVPETTISKISMPKIISSRHLPMYAYGNIVEYREVYNVLVAMGSVLSANNFLKMKKQKRIKSNYQIIRLVCIHISINKGIMFNRGQLYIVFFFTNE